jgi:hypothetical protein
MAKTFDDSDFADAVPAKTFTDDDFVQPSSWLRRNVADPAIALTKGLIGVPETVVGLADLSPAVVLGTKAYKAAFGSDKDKETGDFGLVGRVVQSTGLDFKKAKTILDSMLSPEQQADDRYFRESVGFFNKVKAAVQRPAIIVQGATESAPTMLTGAALARTVMAVAPKVAPLIAAAIGESLGTYGQNAEGVRQESAGGMMTGKQVGTMGASSAATGLLGFMGGKAARKLGIADVDVLLGTGTGAAGKKNVARRVIEGMLSEGVLEELPQSTQERIAQNLASGKKWDEGVADAAVQGMMSGMAMGGASNVFGGNPKTLESWASANPEAAAALAAKEAPSRKDFDAAGLPRASAQDRAATAEVLRGLDLSMPDPTAVQEAPAVETPAQPLTVDGKDMKPGETVPAGQHEIDGKTVLMSAATPVEDVQAMMQQEAPAEPQGEVASEPAVSIPQTVSNAKDESIQAPVVRLRRELSGAKPRYSYGSKQFELAFESDVDKAAYITAQKTKSKRDADYLDFAMKSTGMDEAGVREYGSKVRERIKGQAKDAEAGTLNVDATVIARQAPPAPAPAPEAAPKKKIGRKGVKKALPAEQVQLSPDVGARKQTPEGAARVEAARAQLREVINNPDIVGAQRADMIENGRNLVHFLQANADTSKPIDEGFEYGDRVAYDGEDAPEGMRSFIYLEGAKAGQHGVASTPERMQENAARKQKEFADEQAEFAKLRDAQASKAEAEAQAEVDEQERIANGTKRIGDTYKPVAETKKPETPADTFVASMNPMAAQRARNAMDKSILAEGRAFSRRELVERDISEGAKVVTASNGERRLQKPDGRYRAESQISKTAMDYAEHILASAAPAVSSPATAAPATDEKGRTTAEVVANVPSAYPAASVKVETAPDGDKTLSVPAKDKPGLPPKEQKKWLLAEIDKALQDAPEERVAMPPSEKAVQAQADLERLQKGMADDDVNALMEKYGVARMTVAKSNYTDIDGKEQKFPAPTEIPAGERLKRLRDSVNWALRPQWEMVEFEVPGDGTFKVINNKKDLENFKKRSKSLFPSAVPSKALPTQRSTAVPSVAKVGKPQTWKGTEPEAVKLLEPFASQDETRKVIMRPHYDAETGAVIATDGRRLAVLIASKGDGKGKEEGWGRKMEGDMVFPNHTQPIPGYVEGSTPKADSDTLVLKGIETEPLLRKMRQGALVIAEREDTVVRFVVRKNGQIDVAAKGTDVGEYASGDGDGVSLGFYNPDYAIEAIEFLRRTGADKITVHSKSANYPIVFIGNNAYVVQMPVTLTGPGSPAVESKAAFADLKAGKSAPRAEIDEGAPLPAGVGAARAANTQEFFGDAVGTKHAYTEARRAQLGLPERTKREPVADEAVAAEVAAMYAENPSIGQYLMATFAADPKRVPSAVHEVIFKRETVDAEKELNDAVAEERAAMSANDDARIEAAQIRLKDAGIRIDNIFKVSERGGSEWGAAGRMRQVMMDADYSLGRLVWNLKKAQGGKDLSEEQMAELVNLKKDHAELIRRLANRDKELSASEANAKWLAVSNEILAAKEKTPFRKKMLSLSDQLEAEALASMKARGARMSLNVDPTLLLDIGKLGAAKLIRGGVALSDWTAKIRAEYNLSNDDMDKVLAEAERIARGARDNAVSEQSEQRKTKREKNVGQGELSKEVKALMREQVESGVTTLEEATANVQAELAGSYEGLTTEKVLDIFSGREKQRADLNRDPETVAAQNELNRIKRKLAEMKKQAQMAYGMTGAEWIKETNKYLEGRGVKLPADVQSEIEKGFRDADTIEDSTKRAQAIHENVSKLSVYVPFKAGEWLDAYRYTNMLSNPQSHERNIYGNVIQALVTRPLSLIANGNFTGATKYFTKAFTSVLNGDALMSAKESFKHDFGKWTDNMGDINASIFDVIRREQGPKGGAYPVAWKTLTAIPKILQAQDAFFGAMIEAGEVARLTEKGVSAEEAQAIARRLSEKYLYRTRFGIRRDASLPWASQALDGLANILEKARTTDNQFIRWPMKFAVPFLRTPMRIAQFGVESSPLAWVGTGMNRDGIAKDHFGEPYERLTDAEKTIVKEELQNRIGLSAVGTMVSLVGLGFAVLGKTTWGTPDDEEERELFYASGRRPYSFLVGDKWVPMSYLGPFFLAFALPAAARDAFAENTKLIDKSFVEKLGKAAFGIPKIIINQTPTSGVNGLLEMLQGKADRTLSSNIGFQVGQFIPGAGVLRWMAKIVDPVYRRPVTVYETIAAGIPGLSDDLKSYKNMGISVSERDWTDLYLPYTVGNASTRTEKYAADIMKRKSEKVLASGTDPSASDDERERAAVRISKMGTDAARDALRESQKNPKAWEGDKKTDYGERLDRFNKLARMAKSGERPATTPEEKSKLEIGSALWKAANKPDDEGMREIAVRMLSKMKVDEARSAFAAHAKRMGKKGGWQKEELEKMIKESGAE